MDLTLPHLGEGADSGTVVNLFVKEGDQIAKDQPMIELENEKAVATIPSTAAGRITKIFVKTGDKISVGQRILAIEEGAASKAEAGQPAAEAKPAKEEPKPRVSEREAAEEAPTEAKPGIAPAASPSIRKLARDVGIDLTRVHGSARGGRIELADVRAYVQRLQGRAGDRPAPEVAPAPKAAPEAIDFSKWGAVTKQPLSALRKVIARRMAESWTSVPRVTQFDEADITDLDALRKKYGAAYEQKGTRLTLTSFVLRAAAEVLRKHPALNSSLDEAAQVVVIKHYIHIGVAIDTEAGLIVPVIRDVDKKSMLDLSKELEEMAKKARERKLSAEELKGGSFTISNQGGIGGGHFTPIVNKPEVAILGLGRGGMKAVVRENRVEPRLMLPVALSYDHRVIDGAAAARFMVDLVKGFEQFDETALRL